MLDPKITSMKPTAAKWKKILAESSEALSLIVSERDEYMEGKSDNWRDGDKGQDFESTTEEIRDIVDNLSSLEV